MIIGIESLEMSLKTVTKIWKMQISVTLLITLVNFLTVYDTKHLRFRLQSSEI